MLTYQEALEYVHNTLQFGSKPGLERIGRLLKKLGNPQNSLHIVHVTGTNGKGSVCAATASVLQAAGYKTGLYISPYVVDFCERIQINGLMIPREEFAREVEAIIPFVRQTAKEYEHPTEFEIITALAFNYFKKTGCDVVVLEVGLGGRFDATNIIENPLVSVITSISLDHMAILGDTLGKIAFEKCGIIKSDRTTISSPGQEPEALAVIRETCDAKGNQLVIPEAEAVKILSESITGTRIAYRCRKLFIPLCGRHQITNFITVYEIAVVLRERCGLVITDEAIANGFAQVKFPARMEILRSAPMILLDGGHNPSAAQALVESIDRYLKNKKITVIMGIFKDKDYQAVIPLIAKRAQSFIAVRPDNPRALAPEITEKIAAEHCKKTICLNDYEQAFETALAQTGTDDVILICGSFYLAGPMRRIVLGNL